MSELLHDETDAAKYLGDISTRTLQRYRLTGEGPSFVKIGRVVGYRQSDLDSYILARRRTSTSDAGVAEKRRRRSRT